MGGNHGNGRTHAAFGLLDTSSGYGLEHARWSQCRQSHKVLPGDSGHKAFGRNWPVVMHPDPWRGRLLRLGPLLQRSRNDLTENGPVIWAQCPGWGTGIQADSMQDLITVDITDANNRSLVHEARLNGFRTHAICLLPEVGAIVRAERFNPQLRQRSSSSAGVRASIRPSPTEGDAPADGDSRRSAVRKDLTLPTAKGGEFLRGTDLRQLYSQTARQTRPTRSPAGLRVLGKIACQILLTYGLDDAIHFTPPTIA